MERLTFNKKGVARLILAVEKGYDHQDPYGEGPAKPALILTGDEGVYLTGNQNKNEDEHFTGVRRKVFKRECVYSYESNPKKMEFDDWWDAKRRTFGGSDGCITLKLRDVNVWVNATKGDVLMLDINANCVALTF